MSQLFSNESDRNPNQTYSKSNWEGQAINNLRQGLKKDPEISRREKQTKQNFLQEYFICLWLCVPVNRFHSLEGGLYTVAQINTRKLGFTVNSI